jgi:cbb3-type cytochrome c oxidase subunit III
VCHGVDLEGRTDIGAPNLEDKVWLYGSGRVYEIERTLLYGVRSGHSKTHNVTDMPGFGLAGTLTADEVRSVVQYILKLSNRPYQVEAANEGEALYDNAQKGGCGDCHGVGARGDRDYGSADLTVNVWNSGSTEQDLYKAIYYGQHRVMPAWIDVLSLQDIRALSLYLSTVSHSAPAPAYEQPEATATRAQEGMR